jgi:hypothetical protein
LERTPTRTLAYSTGERSDVVNEGETSRRLNHGIQGADLATARRTPALEDRIEALMAGSERIDRDDPAWQESARHRQWMRHWPGVLSV